MQGTAPTRPRLLIADDDPVIGVLMRQSLEHAFEIVAVAPDSEEAIAIARSCLPDVALVDVEMPKGGGPRAVRGIVEASPDTVIVMLSGDESDAIVRELIGSGAVAYCRKGIDPEKLAALMIGAIESRAAVNARSASRPEVATASA